jgi:hypothetical protein
VKKGHLKESLTASNNNDVLTIFNILLLMSFDIFIRFFPNGYNILSKQLTNLALFEINHHPNLMNTGFNKL